MKRMVLAAAAALALAPASLSAQVITKEPASGSRLQTYFPSVSATLTRQVKPASVHLFLDGRDVSSSASLSNGSLHYMPRERIASGWHDVFLEGVDVNNRPFSDSWTFQTQAPDVAEVATAGNDFEFFSSGGGFFFPDGFVHFFLIAPGDGFATLQLCGLGAFPFEHVAASPVFFATVPISEFPFTPFFDCQASAFFAPFGGFNTEFIPVPIVIDIFGDRRHKIVTNQVPLRTTTPVFRAPERPAISAPGVTTFGTRSTMPSYRRAPGTTTTMPYVPSSWTQMPGTMPGTALPGHAIQMPQTPRRFPGAMPMMGIPHMGIPHAAIPHIPH